DYLALRGGAVVKTLATTDLVDEIAKRHNLKLFEVPVGFKYVSEIMRNYHVLIGGEESGGFSFKGHIPEKDGILTSCFVLEACARRKKTPYELFSEVERKYGKRFSKRIGVSLEGSKRFSNFKVPRFVSGLKVLRLDKRDGIKIYLKDSWLLLRPSGTENLLRIYGEARDKNTLNKLLQWGLNFVERVIS
ncbi:MAG: phosphoglucomutase/phosphomannomutase family protein, partial [Candidatus Methanofastidiosia archaeon]